MSIAWKATGVSDVGRIRTLNEDAFRIDHAGGVFILADGMGGHAAGEVASRIAADAAHQVLHGVRGLGPEETGERLNHAFREARDRIVHRCASDLATRGMGTTLVAAVLSPAGTLHVAHIGDSRLYHLTGGNLHQLTHDHTWVQREIDAGRVSPDAAQSHPRSHILTRVLTAEDPWDPDLLVTTTFPGDLLLLCSDGLYNMVPDTSILEILLADGPIQRRARQMVVAANRHGGADNITAILVSVTRPGSSEIATDG